MGSSGFGAVGCNSDVGLLSAEEGDDVGGMGGVIALGAAATVVGRRRGVGTFT